MEINFEGPYQKFDVCETLGLDPMLFGKDYKEIRQVLLPKVYEINEKNLDPMKLNEKQLLDKLIEHHIETLCVAPSFIMNHPVMMSPLAKTHAQGKYGLSEKGESAQYLSERFELFINNKEVINAYSEQNDAEMQRKGFLFQTNLDNQHDGG